jgi:hypothetical protein
VKLRLFDFPVRCAWKGKASVRVNPKHHKVFSDNFKTVFFGGGGHCVGVGVGV